MKEKQYKVTLTKSQLRLVAHAVEDWHRFLAGQCEMVHATSLVPNRKAATDALRQFIKPHVTPELTNNASYSWDGRPCPNEHQRNAIAMSYGIYRQILHFFATQREDNDWNVYVAPTLTCEEQGPLIKIEEEQL